MSDIKPSKETERLILESVLVKQLNGVIKKLNDEVDMLTKQKQFLQSKLREATGGKIRLIHYVIYGETFWL